MSKEFMEGARILIVVTGFFFAIFSVIVALHMIVNYFRDLQ